MNTNLFLKHYPWNERDMVQHFDGKTMKTVIAGCLAGWVDGWLIGYTTCMRRGAYGLMMLEHERVGECDDDIQCILKRYPSDTFLFLILECVGGNVLHSELPSVTCS